MTAPRAAITTFSVQMGTSGVENWFQQHGLQIPKSIATNIISCGMSDYGAGVRRTILEIICLLTSDTHGGITTYIERSAIPTPRQPMQDSRRAMFTQDSTCFDIFPGL